MILFCHVNLELKEQVVDFFVLYGDGIHRICPILCFVCEKVLFFDLDCFSACVGMGKATFLLICYVG